jgi:alpha-methylacyl-CoA racemase
MGPLYGLKVIEFAGIGAVPLTCMILADLGATVLRIDRTEPSGLGISRPTRFDLLLRGRQSIKINLKSASGKELALKLATQADAVIEGFRPGVMERLGLGPSTCLALNPRLIYGRMTGWGQEGPLATSAGHDINYIALSGILDAIGPKNDSPTPPLNMVGDNAGALFLAIGILGGLWETHRSGKGQVIDASMLDSTNLLSTGYHGLLAANLWHRERGQNVVAGGAFYYGVYVCADGRELAVGAIEPKFYSKMICGFGFEPDELPQQQAEEGMDKARSILAERIKTRTRDEWCEIFSGTDACVSPVLSFEEAARHPHGRARSAFLDIDGISQPAPTPRYSRTVADIPSPPKDCDDKRTVLSEWGVDGGEVLRLAKSGAFE